MLSCDLVGGVGGKGETNAETRIWTREEQETASYHTGEDKEGCKSYKETTSSWEVSVLDCSREVNGPLKTEQWYQFNRLLCITSQKCSW